MTMLKDFSVRLDWKNNGNHFLRCAMLPFMNAPIGKSFEPPSGQSNISSKLCTRKVVLNVRYDGVFNLNCYYRQ